MILLAAPRPGTHSGAATPRDRIQVFPITPDIAVLSQSNEFSHGDPAGRPIAATALLHRARSVTSDWKLRKLKEMAAIW